MPIDREIVDQYISGKLVDPLNPNNPEVTPTSVTYSGDHNGYTEERNALHDAIIANHLDGKSRGSEKQLIAVSGGMSVGMTYMKRLLENQGVVQSENFVVISPLSVLDLPEFQERDHYQHAERSLLLNDEYFHVVQRIIQEAYDKGLSICLVDMGDNAELMLQTVERTRQDGYASAMFGLTIKEEGYFEASEIWQKAFGRIADHPRAFGLMRDFTRNWDRFTAAFDNSVLLETKYDQDERLHNGYIITRSRREYDSTVATEIVDQDRYANFQRRAYLEPAQSVEKATANYPERNLVLPTDVSFDAHETDLSKAVMGLSDEGFTELFASESRRKLVERARRTEFREKKLTSIVGYFNRSAEAQAHGKERPVTTAEPFTLSPTFFEDKRRIEASAAWRRTKDISQFKVGTSFTVQNRLTHTVYAQNIGEMISSALGMGQESVDLIKAMVAAHDIGHSPFNHRGERAIAGKLKEYGQEWDHDAAGLRVIHEWEKRSKDYSGLNLSIAVMEGLAKRFWRFAKDPKSRPADNRFERPYEALPQSIIDLDQHHNLHLDKFNTAEGQIVGLSDWIAFTGTDIEDGLRLGVYDLEELCEHFDAAKTAYEVLEGQLDGIDYDNMGEAQRIAFARMFAETIQGLLIQDVVEQSTKNIERAYVEGKLEKAEDVRDLDKLVISFSKETQADLAQLNNYNYEISHGENPGKKIPYQDFVSEMMDAYITGEIELPGTWKQRYDNLSSEADRAKLIAEFMVCEAIDQDVLDFIVKYRQDKYADVIPLFSNGHDEYSEPAL